MFNPNSSQDCLLLIVPTLQDLEKLLGYRWSKTISGMELNCCFSAHNNTATAGPWWQRRSLCSFSFMEKTVKIPAHKSPTMLWRGVYELLQAFLRYHIFYFQLCKNSQSMSAGQGMGSKAWLSPSRESKGFALPQTSWWHQSSTSGLSPSSYTLLPSTQPPTITTVQRATL